MPCCQCQAIECEFDTKTAAAELKRYRERGPARTTQMLIEALMGAKIEGTTLLDIGGGIGAIQHALLDLGISHATAVEGSAAYLAASQDEARRRGHIDRVRYLHGDFVERADEISPADVVILDRVICCYPDMPSLVERSSARARKLYGLVYPRDTWWNRAGLAFLNLLRRLRRDPFRVFVHRPEDVEAAVRANGLAPLSHGQTVVWRVDVYVRREAMGTA
jgi:magnesium-protoporphyrin O-methyltransferase